MNITEVFTFSERTAARYPISPYLTTLISLFWPFTNLIHYSKSFLIQLNEHTLRIIMKLQSLTIREKFLSQIVAFKQLVSKLRVLIS